MYSILLGAFCVMAIAAYWGYVWRHGKY